MTLKLRRQILWVWLKNGNEYSHRAQKLYSNTHTLKFCH